MGKTYGLASDGCAKGNPKLLDKCRCGLEKIKASKNCFMCEKELRRIRPELMRIAVKESVKVARETMDALRVCAWLTEGPWRRVGWTSTEAP